MLGIYLLTGLEIFLLLNKNILEQGKEGIFEFDTDTMDDNFIYIDQDGVGIEIGLKIRAEKLINQ